MKWFHWRKTSARLASAFFLVMGAAGVGTFLVSLPADALALLPAHPTFLSVAPHSQRPLAQLRTSAPPLTSRLRPLTQPSAMGSQSSSSGVSWTPLGPGPELGGDGGPNSGRVTGLAVTSGASPTLYLASAGGGVWSSSNSGASWATTTDAQPNLAMGSITVDPDNSQYVFAGTGEANQCLDCRQGSGVMESLNGGATWTTSNPGGIFTDKYISSVVVEPGASSLSTTTVLAGTDKNLYVSHDGGTTWNPETGSGWVTGKVQSVVLNSLTSPMTIYAWVSGTGVEMSADNGSTWSTIQSAGATSTPGFGKLAIYANASSANTVLFDSVGSNSGYVGMYKSTDGGATWTLLTNCTASSRNCIPYFTSINYAYNNVNNDSSDQSWYDNTVAIDPLNPNIIVAGGVTAIESTDGGANWVSLDGASSFTKFHPDFHALVFDSAGNLYLGNDGGVWEMSAANLASKSLIYSNLNTNLDITQFYPGISQVNNGAEIIGGTQDNGTVQYLSTSSSPSTWNEVDSGDGGGTAINPSNANFQISESDISSSGALDYTTNNWKTQPPQGLTLPPFASTNWWSPVLIVPNTVGPTIVFGGDGVYGSTNGGSTWTTPTGYQGANVSALALAPSNSSVMYAGFSNGTLQMSINAGATWSTIDKFANSVSHLSVNANDPFTVYASVAYAQNGVITYVDTPQVVVGSGLNGASPSWVDVTGNLPANDQTDAVVTDGHGGLLVANDIGVYWASSLNGSSTNWTRLGSGLPNVQTVDLLLTPNGTLIAATHGRGVWTIPFSTILNAPTTTCTWTGGSGASGSDWSVGSNWTTTSGASCTGAGGPPAGAQIVFPASPMNGSVTWDSGTESGGGGAVASSFDSITFQGSSSVYTFTNANASTSITLAPSVATSSCGVATTIGLCAAYPSGSLHFPVNLTLNANQEIAVVGAAGVLVIDGTISDLVGSLSIGDATNQGTVSIDSANNGLTANTVVDGGTLDVNGTIPNSAVSVQSGATLEGAGTVGSITNDGGAVVPQLVGGAPATLTSAGGIYLQASGNAVFKVDLVGTSSSSSLLTMSSGILYFDNASLDINLGTSLVGGSTIVIVSLGAGAVATGKFNGLSDGARVVVNGETFVISYPSQDGGDPTQGAVLTALTVPDAPSAPSATSANAAASVTWSAPANDGGLSITGYTVTAADATTPANGGQTCSWTSGPLTCQLSGLTNGDHYTFSVTATNPVGTSSASASSSAVTPLPPIPSALRLSFSAKSATLSASARAALKNLSRHLIAGASVTVTGYAPKNAKLAGARAHAVSSFLSSLVRLRIATSVRTSGSAKMATIVTTRQ